MSAWTAGSGRARVGAGSGSDASGRTATSTGLAVGTGGGTRVAFLVFEEDSTDVVDGDMDGVGDTGDGEDALGESVWIQGRNNKEQRADREARLRRKLEDQAVLTSVDPGSIASLAFSLAPDASWISLILEPPLPMLRGETMF